MRGIGDYEIVVVIPGLQSHHHQVRNEQQSNADNNDGLRPATCESVLQYDEGRNRHGNEREIDQCHFFYR